MAIPRLKKRFVASTTKRSFFCSAADKDEALALRVGLVSRVFVLRFTDLQKEARS
jgi:hypothetical protein